MKRVRQALGAWGMVVWLSVDGWAAVTGVRVLGTTNTQAVLAYTAPDGGACTVEVSENPSWSPVVNDVNGAYFPGSELDTRAGSVVRGRERVMVIGKRTVDRAPSGIAYSRALQAATVHYYRLTCGGDQAAGTFQTGTIPFGNTHTDPVIPDPDEAGFPMHITPVYQRNKPWVDPHTGARVHLVSQPQDNNQYTTYWYSLFTQVLEANNWANASNALADDSQYATYDGTSCGATCDWLMLHNSTGTSSTVERTDVIMISVRGSATAAAPADRTIEVCPIQMSTTEIDPQGECKDLILPQTRGLVESVARGIVDTWRKPGGREWSTGYIYSYGHLRFALRKKTATGSVNVDAVYRTWFRSQPHNNGTGSNFDRCSPLPRTDDDGARYLCTAYTPGAAMTLYSVNAETGDVRFLGIMYKGPYAINQDHTIWDAVDPNRFYALPSGDTKIWAFTYTGSGQNKASGFAELSAVEVLTTGGLNLTQGVKAFVAANLARYPFGFDDTKYSCVTLAAQGDHLLLKCPRGSQDTYGWLAAYRISAQEVVAATPFFAAPAARWCVNHSQEILGDQDVSVTVLQAHKNSYTGNGYYITKLAQPIDATQTTIQVTSTCVGTTCAGHVTGEPVSSFADNYLMPAEEGDVFQISDVPNHEYIRIVQKISPTQWVVARNADGATGAREHANNANVLARCANKPGAGPAQFIGTPLLVWDYLGDPYGMDGSGQFAWMNHYAGHATARLNTMVATKQVALSAEGTQLLKAVKNPPFTINLPQAPFYAGKYAPAYGNTWQQHPGWHQVAASREERKYFWDVQPFIGGNLILPSTPGCDPTLPAYPAPGGCAAARVPGYSKVYRLAITGASVNPDGLNPKHLELFGVAETRVMRDVSGPGSVLDDSPARDYTFCVAARSGECMAGSAAGEVYVQLPNLTLFYCSGGESYGGGSDVCVSDFPMMGGALGQYGINRSKDGGDPAYAANESMVGAGWMRELAKMGLHISYRTLSTFATGKALANGKWILSPDWIDGSLLALVKVPPILKDTVSRTTFVPVTVRIGPGAVPKGTQNVVVEFGYAERGAAGDYRCTSRAESCVATGTVVNEANPFSWAETDTYTGVACANGCAVAIPAYPTRVVYYRVKYRDAANQVVYTGPMQIAVAP